jgi:hypothetical protein
MNDSVYYVTLPSQDIPRWSNSSKHILPVCFVHIFSSLVVIFSHRPVIPRSWMRCLDLPRYRLRRILLQPKTSSDHAYKTNTACGESWFFGFLRGSPLDVLTWPPRQVSAAYKPDFEDKSLRIVAHLSRGFPPVRKNPSVIQPKGTSIRFLPRSSS